MVIAYVDDREDERNQGIALFLNGFRKMNIPVHRFDFFENGQDFLNKWVPGAYDLIILDIFLGDTHGVDIAKEIRSKDDVTRIVFCSTSNEFANQSYDVDASYYIMKPVNEISVENMIKRLQIEDFELRRFITLPDGQKIIVRNIISAEYSNHLVTIRTKIHEDIRCWCSFAQFTQLLKDFDFICVVNSGCLVNFYEVTEFNKDDFTMSNEETVLVSRRKKADVKRAYEEFLIKQIRNGV